MISKSTLLPPFYIPISVFDRRLIIFRSLLTMIVVVLMSVVSSSHAKTFYLQGTIATNPNPAPEDRSYWWDAPSGGSSMQSSDSFAGNFFDINGYTFKTLKTDGSDSFSGTLVKDNGSVFVYADIWNLAALDVTPESVTVNNGLVLRQSDMQVNIDDMKLDGFCLVRASSTERDLKLKIGNLSGSGELAFGRDADEIDQLWELDISESDFTGIIDIRRGSLKLNRTIVMPDAELKISSSDSSVILKNSLIVRKMSYLSVDLPAGTYRASQLNAVFSTDKFSGAGVISIEPLVHTIQIETQPDGSGVVIPTLSLQSGEIVNCYAIARDSGGTFISNISAAWKMTDATGFIVDGDFLPSADGRSAQFVAGGFGTARFIVNGHASNLIPSNTITVSAAPVLSSSRPFVWVKKSDRSALLNKIENYPWAKSLAQALVERAAGELTSYEADPDAYIRELPIKWTASPPVFYYESQTDVRYTLGPKLHAAQDCAILYYITGNTRYARLAADVLHNSVKNLSRTPVVGSHHWDGWLFPQNLLLEARVIGCPMPIIYDFLEPYLRTTNVYDVQTGGNTAFSFSSAQSVFDKYWKLCRDRGGSGNNWGSLMGGCMVHNILGLDNVGSRNAAIDVYLYTGGPLQDSLQEDHQHFDRAAPYAIYPESFNYAKDVVTRDSYYMALIERIYPAKTLYNDFSLIPESVHRLNDFNFPNGSQMILVGDGHRDTTPDPSYFIAELIYQHAKRIGRADLAETNGGIVINAMNTGRYDRSRLLAYGSLTPKYEPLQLLWFEPEVNETPVVRKAHTTDTVPYAGLALQRNLSPNNDPDYGLMTFVNGAGYVHSHGSGMYMELYGMGEVLGAKTTGRTNYTRSFASANTVIVNGYSRGDTGWKDISINTVQVESMEPAARRTPVSPNNSFTCTSFVDNRGTGAEADQQRTMAIVRTSPTTGYYVDIFRSNSSLANEYHDYIYHNIGDSLSLKDYNGNALSLTSQANRFQNDNDGKESPGWGYFSNTMASAEVTDSVRAQFVTNITGATEPIYMDLHIPGGFGREYVSCDAPAVGEMPKPYDNQEIPTLVVRKNGEAWNNPFAVVYEAHKGAVDSGSVQNVTTLKQNGVLVGLRVRSLVEGNTVIQYVISNPTANATYTNASVGLSFKGRFAVISDYGGGDGDIYIGEGSHVAYGSVSVSTQSGANTEASIQFDAAGQTAVKSNDPLEFLTLGNTFYLHEDITVNPDPVPQDPTYWWDDPLAGNQMRAVDPFAGNYFDLNGNIFRTKNHNGSSSFDGTMIKGNAPIMVYAQTWDLAALIVGEDSTTANNGIRMRRSNMNLNIGEMDLDGLLLIRANTSERNMNLNVTNLSGNGLLAFGRDADEDDHLWDLNVGGNTFSGSIEIRRGNLKISNAMDLSGAGLSINSSVSTIEVLDNLSLYSLSYLSNDVPGGTYTPVELNTLLGIDKFLGVGTVSIVGDPYNKWVSDQGLDESESGELLDVDGDGLSNLAEYALGGTPNISDAEIVRPEVNRNGSSIEFRFKREQASVTYVIEKSTDLQNWTDHATVTDAHGSVGNFATVPVSVSEMNNGKLFLRLKVEK